MDSRELDAYLAEKLLGYVWRLTKFGGCRFLMPPTDPDVNYYPDADNLDSLCADAYRFVPALSSTFEGMRLILEAMPGKGFTWAAEFFEDNGKFTAYFKSTETWDRRLATDASLPLAVALAAKAALEDEKHG